MNPNMEAFVENPLVMTDSGVESYMRVNAPNAGSMLILPSPSYSGLYAQLRANTGERVKIATVGRSRFVTVGVLLNNAGVQYGHPMSYGPRSSDMLYIFSDTFFPRGKISADKSNAKNSYMVVDAFTNKLTVRYSRLDPLATPKDLNEFQGFVAKLPSSDYVIWFPLNMRHCRLASKNANYLGISNILSPKIYSFTSQSDRINKEIFGSSEPAPIAPVSEPVAKASTSVPAPVAKATVAGPPTTQPVPAATPAPKDKAVIAIATRHGTVPYELPAGMYSLEGIVAYRSPATPRKLAMALEELEDHFAVNNPVVINSRDYQKTSRIELEAGKRYDLRMAWVTVDLPAPQPVIAPRSAAAAPYTPTAPRPTHRQEAARPINIASRESRNHLVEKNRRSATGG